MLENVLNSLDVDLTPGRAAAHCFETIGLLVMDLCLSERAEVLNNASASTVQEVK